MASTFAALTLQAWLYETAIVVGFVVVAVALCFAVSVAMDRKPGR